MAMKKTSKKNAVLKTAIRDKQTEHIGMNMHCGS